MSMGDPPDFAAENEPEAGKSASDEPSTPGMTDAPVSPPLPDGTLWGEVGAVLAIGVVPHILATGVSLWAPQAPPLPYWLDAIQLMVWSGCVIFVALYLIQRSGESWERFGMSRPRLWDVLFGLGLFLASDCLWMFCGGLVTWEAWATTDYQFPRLQHPADYGLMVIRHGANGFAEELVTRAYLVTRFEYLLKSRGAAVVLAAALFASYHGYQGVAGIAHTLAFGLLYGVAFLMLRRVWPLAIGHALFNIRLELAA
ncbi:MAG: CPBP family intramembrane glutamic endopeptidase [Pirellulaceae bacterium]